MNNNKSLVILDVRNPDELTGPMGKIDGVINIPISKLETRIVELNKYKKKDIALICKSGVRSAKGIKILINNEFNARNVVDGMIAFRKK